MTAGINGEQQVAKSFLGFEGDGIGQMTVLVSTQALVALQYVAKIDQAALDILRRASPFEPFPPEIRADYDRLRFAYKWVFSDDLKAATASAN